MTLGLILTAVALLWLWLVDNYIPDVASEGEPGPRALPFLLGVLLAILGVALAAQKYVGRVPPSTSVKDAKADPPMTRTALATVAMLLGYAFLLDTLGFMTSTIILMLAAMAGVLGMRRWVFMSVFAAAFAAGTWLVFNALLGIPLPRDPWLASLQ